MNNLIDDGGRLERNLTWQARTDSHCNEHWSRVAAIIEEGGVLRRCVQCGCALLHRGAIGIEGDEAFRRCASCGSLEAE